MDRVDIYDPATDTWAKGPKMPTRRNPGGVAVVNTRIYVIGGEGWPPPPKTGGLIRFWGALLLISVPVGGNSNSRFLTNFYIFSKL